MITVFFIRYSLNMARVSSLMHDQPDRPLDRATYWIEYVIRHRGAQHLRTKNRWMSLLQRGMIDVLLIVITTSCLMVLVAFKVSRAMLSAFMVLTRGLLLEPASNQSTPAIKRRSIPGNGAKSKKDD